MVDETRIKNIGCNISALRQERGMTQAQLAEKVSVSTDHIAHAECGYDSISLRFLLDICTVLNVTPNDILAGAYAQDDVAEGQGKKILPLFDVSPDDRLLLEYFHHFMAGRKNER